MCTTTTTTTAAYLYSSSAALYSYQAIFHCSLNLFLSLSVFLFPFLSLSIILTICHAMPFIDYINVDVYRDIQIYSDASEYLCVCSSKVYIKLEGISSILRFEYGFKFFFGRVDPNRLR